ncbi:MAG: sugar phosphate nucleotidyltransferase [Candidatus Methylomirabilia bacterium]
MDKPETPQKMPLARIESGATPQGNLWAIVLAGGEGVRLRALTRRLYGKDRPKQYAALWGSRSLLRQTLDRVALAIPPERTVLVTLRSHAGYIASEFAGSPMPRVLVQPESRGTAAGVLFPAHWIQWQDPEATVAVFPSDHFILEAAAFMEHVLEVEALVRRHPDWLVLLGAQPNEAETEYGWIEPGELLDRTPLGPLWRVRQFWEKPSEATVRTCLAGGCLWNTFVFVATLTTLLEAGQQLLPDLSDRLARIAPFTGTDDEPWAVQQAYALAPKANFSRAVLEACLPFLVVSRLPAIGWSDWGTPERVVGSLRKAGIFPLWLTGLDRPA